MIIILTKKLYLSYCSVNLRVFFFNVILTILVGYIYKSHKLRIMKLNTKSRYAVMALADMARFDGKNPVSLRDISLRQSISLLYLEQIFLRLKKNNIVKSIRGTNGGYIISKNINELKILLANNATEMLHGIKEAEKSEKLAKNTFKENSTGENLPGIKVNNDILSKNIVELISFVRKLARLDPHEVFQNRKAHLHTKSMYGPLLSRALDLLDVLYGPFW